MINRKNVIFPSGYDEMKLFVSKACDLYNRAESSGRSFFTRFLTPLEQKIILDRFPKNGVDIDFWGGYDGSERNMARFSSAQYDYNYDEPYPACALVIARKSKEVFSHRDYLGSVLALGIKREMIGDIVIRESDAVVFCVEEIASYVEDNLFKIGHDSVTVRREDCIENLEIKREFEEISLTVSSMRADCIVSALCNVSRSGASELIERGLVTLNYEVLTSNSRIAGADDVISVRGKGKFKIGSDSKPTRKGRIHINAFRYV